MYASKIQVMTAMSISETPNIKRNDEV